MSQRLVTPFINTNIPGAYPNITVQSSPVGLGQSGIVVIIGEADGGPSYQNVALKDNSFTPDQLDKVQNIYLSGSIVDAMRALSAPSNDADIVGTANRVFIVKTNNGSRASALVATNYGTFTDLNYGIDGNKYKYQVTTTAAEVAPSREGGTIPAFGAPLNGDSFTLRFNGGVAYVITLSATPASHANVATLVVELNALLPAGVTAAAGAAPNSIKLSVNADPLAYDKGWGKSLELFDSTPGDLAALGLSAGLTLSSQEPGVEVSITRPDIGFSETLDASAVVGLSVGYLGTTGTLTITAGGLLTTAITGGLGANLSIDLNLFQTLQDLATFIASNTGYSALVEAGSQQLSPLALDLVAAIPIASNGVGLRPGRIKKSATNFSAVMNTSTKLSFVALPAGEAGLPAPMASAAFLSGGTRGTTLAADIIDVLDQVAGIQVNIIVPLFSRDAAEDIAAGLTDSGSTYTIAAINAAVKSHCIQYSTPKLKRNRICILSIKDTYLNAKSQAQSLGNYRCSLSMQDVMQQNSVGVIVQFQPWYAAAIAAGMQTGGFYKAIVNKAANVISFVDPLGFDSGSPGDVEDALSAGLLFLSKDTSRNYWVSDQTTYGFDTNFVYNSIQATYCSDILALDLADSFQKAFVGKSLADVDAAVGLSFLAQKMAGYKNLKLIASSTDAPLGYKNPKVTITAPTMDVAVEIKLATAIYFIPISINISAIQSAA